MSIDYAARQMLAERQKERREQLLVDGIATLSRKIDELKGEFSPLGDVSTSANTSAALTGAMVAYIQQSNEILHELLEKLATTEDIVALGEKIVDALALIKEPKTVRTKKK